MTITERGNKKSKQGVVGEQRAMAVAQSFGSLKKKIQKLC